MKKDWRYQEQDRYLEGLTFTRKNYSPTEGNDHDHCEFCGDKFSNVIPDTLKEGWTDNSHYRWICHPCFLDFKEALNLKTVNS